MKLKHPAAARRCLAALVTSLACSGSVALAEPVTLDPVAFGSAWDNGPSRNTMPDGQFDGMQAPGEPLYLWMMTTNETIYREYRTRFEYELPPEMQQLGVTINKATLVAPLAQGSILDGTVGVYLSISPADDQLTLDDFENFVPTANVHVSSGAYDLHHRFDVAELMLDLAGGGHQRLGFVGAISWFSSPAIWTADVKLQVDWSPPSPTLPGLSMLAPYQDEQVIDGTPIRLYAKASDAQDGHIDAAIQWQLTTAGSIYWQGTNSDHILVLPVGDYQATASVTDSDGNTVTHTRNISILPVPDTNLHPTVSIVAPVAGLDLLEGIPTTLQASASDPEDGDVSSSIVWYLDGFLLGNGAIITANLPAGYHSLKAFAYDANAHVATQEININVSAALSYCAAGGYWTNPQYYIGRVGLNDRNNVSGHNGGYTDFTNIWLQAVKGSNTLRLNSAGGSPVYWTVWIDLNRDGVFSVDERLSRFRAVGTNGTVTIPETAATGVTRMRVSMLYPHYPEACAVGYQGETEDYTVVIQ